MAVYALVFACFAYLASIFLAAALPSSRDRRFVRAFLTAPRRETYAATLALAAFIFLPPGSLPPLYNGPHGGLFFGACLGSSLLLTYGRGAIGPYILWTLSFFALAEHAWRRGMPGTPTNLGTFVAMPVWSVADSYAFTGFLFLAFGHALGAASLFSHDAGDASPTRRIQGLAACGLFTVFFLPWNFSSFISGPTRFLAGTDYLLFWTKTLLAHFAAVSFAERFPRAPLLSASAFCCVLGLAAVLHSL